MYVPVVVKSKNKTKTRKSVFDSIRSGSDFPTDPHKTRYGSDCVIRLAFGS